MSIRYDSQTGDKLLDPGEESRPVRRALVFAIVALALLMMSVDSTIAATALESLQHGLQVAADLRIDKTTVG